METQLIKYINYNILLRAKGLKYEVSHFAPNTFEDLINSSSLVVWSGESDNTIFQDETVNWAFRALHDALHLETRIGFTPQEEIELGRIQANQFDGILADLVYCEVAGQAEYYLKTGQFVTDQVEFTKQYLGGLL